MTRTVARQLAVQIGFSVANEPVQAPEALDAFFDQEYFASLAGENELFAEYPSQKQRDYISAVVLGTAEHARELDAYIEKYARGWKISRISRIALTILRTALFEVLYLDEVPDSVAINEAVELAKGFEEPETVSFINGILGSFMRGERGAPPRPEREPENMELAADESIDPESTEIEAVETVAPDLENAEAAGTWISDPQVTPSAPEIAEPQAKAEEEKREVPEAQ